MKPNGDRGRRNLCLCLLTTSALIAAGAAAQPPVQSVQPSIPSAAASADTRALDSDAIRSRLAALTLPFVENHGSFDASVAYWAPLQSGQVYVTRDGALVYQFRDAASAAAGQPGHKSPNSEALDDAAPAADWSFSEHLLPAHHGGLNPQGAQPAGTRVSRFIGSDPKRWDSAAPSFNEVSLGEVWPGVEVQLRARLHSVEKLFTVQPQADVAAIRLQIDGRQALRIEDTSGELIVPGAAGEARFSAPIAWQPAVEGQPQRPVEVAYAVAGSEYGFRVGDYDHSRALVIDPLIRATYLGGTGLDQADTDVALGPNNTIIVAGTTASLDFPGTGGGVQPGRSTGNDMFVASLSRDLTTIVAATYLGGTGADFAFALAVTGSTVYVAGRTTSTNFPGVAGGAQATPGGGADGVIARLPATLTSLTQSTLIGGSSIDQIRALKLAANGDVYVAGDTLSLNLPGTAGGAQPAIGDSQANIDECNNVGAICNIGDVFIARFSATLTTLLQATYFGGSAQEFNRGSLAISPVSGEIYAGGGTVSLDVPGTLGGAQPANGNPTGDPNTFTETADAFIGRFNNTLRKRFQTTYFGGSALDGLRELLVNPTTGEVYASGQTLSTDLPGSSGGFQTALAPAGQSAWLARLPSTLTSIAQSTYLGGNAIVRDLAFSPVNSDLYAGGDTSQEDFPGTAGGALNLINLNGNGGDNAAGFFTNDGFVSRISSDLGTLSRSTYIGGSADEAAMNTFITFSDVLVDPTTGDVLVYGATQSTDLPGTTGAARPTNAGGGRDTFLARFDPTLSGPDTAANPFSIPAQTNVPLSSVVTSAPVTVAGVSAPTSVTVRDGAYSVNGGAFFTTGGAVNNGDQVRVQHTSAATANAVVQSTLGIGGQSAVFSSTTPDTSPDAFAFASQVNVAPGAVVTSNQITVTGISAPAPIAIGGAPGSSYSVNGAPFTTSPATVVAGNRVRVRHTASFNGNTDTQSILTIGDRSATFTSTTQNVDTQPDPFSFPDVTRAKTGKRVTSATVTPAGYGFQARVTVSGATAEYSVNGGGFTSAPGFIAPGQTLQLRQTSAATAATTTVVSVNVGGTTATFSVTTR